MFTVATINLTPDLRTAQPDLGPCDFGQVDEGQLVVLLERFRDIDPLQNHEAEPHVVITGPAGKFVIRTTHRKLFLYDAIDSTRPAAELDSAAIALAAKNRAARPATQPTDSVVSVPSRRRTRHGAAIAILVAGLLLNGYTVYSFFYIDDINRPPPVALLTDSADIAARLRAAAGRYATGQSEGDRLIEIDPTGHVRFFRLAASGERFDSDDTARIGRLDTKLCLATADNGVIEILNIDTLVYYRDTYRRMR